MDAAGLRDLLATLAGSVVTELHTDLRLNTITIVAKSGANVPTRILFEGVSAFFVAPGTTKIAVAQPVNGGDPLEAIQYARDGLGILLQEDFPWSMEASAVASANFALLLVSAIYMIEARSITIEETRFDVGYPPIGDGAGKRTSGRHRVAQRHRLH